MATAFVHIDSNARDFTFRMRRRIVGLPRALEAANELAATELLETLRSHASGRPGPEVQTGRFRANMQVTIQAGGMGINGFNTSPQAERLEQGFVGRDARGRFYHQPPYPWRKPAFEEFVPRYRQLMIKAFKKGVTVGFQ